MKQMLADVFWVAANEHLDSGNKHRCGVKSHYTCDAVLYSVGFSQRGSAINLLRQLGLPKNADSRYDLFDDFEPGEERQGIRYMWLLLAMHVAEDEGLEIEVPA